MRVGNGNTPPEQCTPRYAYDMYCNRQLISRPTSDVVASVSAFGDVRANTDSVARDPEAINEFPVGHGTLVSPFMND